MRVGPRDFRAERKGPRIKGFLNSLPFSRPRVMDTQMETTPSDRTVGHLRPPGVESGWPESVPMLIGSLGAGAGTYDVESASAEGFWCYLRAARVVEV